MARSPDGKCKERRGHLLYNPQYELYAQCRAVGRSVQEAAVDAGFHKGGHGYRLEKLPEVQRRIGEIMQHAANRAELTRKDILDRIFEDWENSRKLGQMTSALKAAELMGKEMHRMFVERKEVGGPGDFDNKSEEELREIITKEMEELGWDKPPTPTEIN
jgi:hypothetical protein